MLIESRLGLVSDQLVDRIADRTDGVPLFVEELTRSILESGTKAHEYIEIPDSLQGSLIGPARPLTCTLEGSRANRLRHRPGIRS